MYRCEIHNNVSASAEYFVLPQRVATGDYHRVHLRLVSISSGTDEFCRGGAVCEGANTIFLFNIMCAVTVWCGGAVALNLVQLASIEMNCVVACKMVVDRWCPEFVLSV